MSNMILSNRTNLESGYSTGGATSSRDGKAVWALGETSFDRSKGEGFRDFLADLASIK